jgi:REP element-mobilizing transposase RayT
MNSLARGLRPEVLWTLSVGICLIYGGSRPLAELAQHVLAMMCVPSQRDSQHGVVAGFSYPTGRRMRRSKIVAPMHFVWATYQRTPLIVQGSEEPLYRCLAGEAARLKCQVLVIGGMPGHVHIAVLFPATITFSTFAKQLKGASSHLMKSSATREPVYLAGGLRRLRLPYRFHRPRRALYSEPGVTARERFVLALPGGSR